MGVSFHGVWSPTSSDAELIAAVRGGDSVAFGQLYERHAGAARAVARQYTNSAADAEDVVSDSFAKVFTILQGGGGPDVAFRAYLFTVVRRVAIASLGAGKRVQPTDDLAQYEGSIGSQPGVDEPAIAGFERGVVAKAYDSLPERWQAVLWYTEVEGLQPAQIGPILGLTANGVAALAYRAREGLRQAYLQNHLTTVKDESCRAVSDKLGAYVRGGLAKREQALVDQRLDECPKCRGLVLELADVNHGMRVVIAPLVLGLVGLAALQQGLPFAGAAASIGTAGGSSAAGGGSAGAGAGVGSGVGVSSGVGSGGGMFGAGASGWLAAASQTAFPSVFAGASSYASVAAARASAGGAHGTLVGAGVGSTGAAGGGAGGSAGFGAIGAFFGSLPTGVLGVLVGGVVIAVGVVSAGALGVFSPGPGTQLGIVADLSPTPSGTTASGTNPTPEPSPGDSPSPSDTSTPSDTPTPGATGGTNPANVPPVVGAGSTSPSPSPAPSPSPGPAPTPTPTASSTPATTTEPTPTPTPTPTPSSTPTPTPTPTPPAPAVLQVGSVTGVDGVHLVSGVPAIVSIPVSNTGGQASGEVVTEFSFPSGVTGTVEALPASPSGGGAARSLFAVSAPVWTCGPTVEGVATCSTPDLAPNAAGALNASVSVRDDGLDGTKDVALGIRTWAPGLGSAPGITTFTSHLASPPAQITAESAAPIVITGSSQETRTGQFVVPIRNNGGTSVPVHATVTLPVDLPLGVSVTAAGDWTCTSWDPGSGLSCY